MRSTTVLLNTALVAVLGLLLLAAAGEDDATAGAPAGIDAATLPPLARQLLPLITQLTAQQCPELPPVWVLAQVQAESGWDPAATSSDSNGGAAGLYQLDQQNWMAAGVPAGRRTRRGRARTSSTPRRTCGWRSRGSARSCAR